MEKQQNTPEKIPSYREMPYFCLECGPFVRVVVENWISGAESLSHIDFVHHVDFEPRLAYKLQIENPSDGQIISIAHCAECNAVLSERIGNHPEWKEAVSKENPNGVN